MGHTTGRPIAIVGAASSIGIRPYDDRHEARHVNQAPRVLPELGLVERLAAHDLGDVEPPPYRDFVRPPAGVRNESEITIYDPALDPDRSCAARLVALVEAVLTDRPTAGRVS